MPRLRAELVHPADLSRADVATWRRLQDAESAFGSPLLSPEFAQAVGAVRQDARVAVLRQDDETIGFLPHHRRPGGFARPIGAPFCDYHALISGPQAPLGQSDVLQAAGLAALRLTGLVDPFKVFEAASQTQVRAHRIVVDGDAQTYLGRLWRMSANRLKNYRRYRRALQRDRGELRIVAHDHSPAAFEQLLGWKRSHIRRTGVHDFLAVGWAEALMRRLFETREPGLEGLMVSLYAGEELVAAHFGVRRGDWFHPWLGEHNPDLGDYSPGLLHQIEAITAMPGLGLRTYDLGPGADHWKSMFALDGAWIGAGLATGPSFGGRIASARDRVWNAPMIGRLRSRLDQIAALELTVAGRLQGAAHAVAGIGSSRRDAAAN